MSQLPTGFILDKPSSGAQLPEGYVLDDPALRSSALPEGYTLDQPVATQEPAYFPSRKPSAIKRKEPEAVASPEPAQSATEPAYIPSRTVNITKRDAPLYEIKPSATPETAELIIDPARYNEGIEAAKRDGLLDDSQVERINQVQAFVDERKALEAQAGDNPELKSYLQGLGRGSAMTLGAIGGAKVAGAGGTAVGGPYVGIPAAIIGGIGGGIAAGKAYDKLYGELGKRFETYNEMLAASQVRPGYNAAGQLTSVAFALPVSATRAVQGLTTAYQAGGAQAVLRTAGTAAGLGAGTGVAGYTINQAVSGAPLEAEEVIKAAGLGVAMGGFFIGNRQVTMQEALAVANKARNGQPLSTGEQQILTRSAQAVRNIAQGVDDAANQDVLAAPRLTDLTMRQSSVMGLMPQTTPAMATVRQMAPVQPGAAAAAQPPGQPTPAAPALPAGAAAVGRTAPPPPGTTTPVPLSVVQNLPVPQPGATQATSGQAATVAQPTVQVTPPEGAAPETISNAGQGVATQEPPLSPSSPGPAPTSKKFKIQIKPISQEATPELSEKASRILKHYTLPERAQQLREQGKFSFENDPVHGTGSLGNEAKLGRFAGKRIYLSLEDDVWGQTTRIEPKGNPVPATGKEDDSAGEFYYDYDKQRWMYQPGEQIVTSLEGVEVALNPRANVLRIDSPQQLQAASKFTNSSWEEESFWERLSWTYDAVEIRNTKQYAEQDYDFFKAATADQLIVLKPEMASIPKIQTGPAPTSAAAPTITGSNAQTGAEMPVPAEPTVTPGADAAPPAPPQFKTKWEAKAYEIRTEMEGLNSRAARQYLKARADVAGVDVPKGMKTEALLEAIAKAETRSRSISGPNTGDGVAPITELLRFNGGIISKGKDYRGGEYDDAPTIGELGGFGRVLYSKDAVLRPDQAAQIAYDAGLIESPTAPALWEALRSEIQTYRSARGAKKTEQDDYDEDYARYYADQEEKRLLDTIKSNTKEYQQNAYSLESGDLTRKDGEWYQVDQSQPGVTKLVDGKTITVDTADTVGVTATLKPGDPGYNKAMAEYNEQEAAAARSAPQSATAEEDDSFNVTEMDAGEPAPNQSIVRGINPQTGQTELLGQEEGGFKLVSQDDPSAAARQARADAEALAQAQAELDARQGRLFGVDPASDIKGAADEQSKGGYIQTPSSRAVRAIGTKIRQLLLPHRGVGNQVYDWWVWSEAQKDAAMVAGRADYERIEGILSEVKQRVPRAQAQQVIREFQDGIKTLPDVEAALGLPPNGPVSQVLKAVEASNRARQQLLAGWPGLSENLRQHILDNVYYQTRAYLKHALGPDFVPQASAVQDATTAIKNDLIDQLDKFDKRATSVRGKRGQVDVVIWLYTGDPLYLAGVSPTRRAAAEGLREQYLNLQHLITGLQQNNNVVTAVRNLNAMGRAAEDVVEFYLSREAPGKGGAQGGIKIANLQHRMLDIAFRKLYGEILDPAMRQRITSEVQGKMLAQMTFFNRVIQEAEGIVWARYADQERGFMYRLGDVQSPSDIKRYGDLNGMYVNKEFYDLINSQKVHDDNVRKVIDALWFVPMSVQRGAKLINPRTIFRNYYTAVLGFAQGSGDAYLPGYWSAYWKAHGLATRYARGDVKALEEIESLYAMNVARVSQNSSVYDLQTSLTGMTGKIGKMGRNVMTAYTFIDFPSKYAAFEARRQYFEQRGMSPDDAAEAAARHVQDLYQNQDRIPEVIRKVTKTGIADYFGYFYDSVRIMGNQFKWAARSMTDYKDPRPMIGLFASRALLLAAGYFTNKFFTDVFSKMHESLRKFWDKQEDRDQKPMSDDRTDAMREFMRDFDKNMPLMAWEERGADGKEYVYITMLSGQSAFPLEDALLGAMTSSATGTEFFKGLGNNLWQSVDPGMYINTWSRLLAGQDLNKQRTPTGMGLYQILVNKEDPDRSAALQDLFFELGKDFAPLGVGPALERINQIKERERAGQNNETWFQRTTTVSDAAASAFRLLRTSRIEQSDMNWMVRETARPYVEAIKKNKSKINLPVKEQVTKGGATETQLAEAEKARSSLIQNRGELVKIARAAHKVNAKWYDQTNLFLTLTGAGIDGPMADSIVREAIYGTPSAEYEYVPNPSFRPTDVLQPDKEMGIYENRRRMLLQEP